MIRNDDEWQKYETIMGNVDRVVYLTRGLRSAVSIRRRCTVAAMALRGSAPAGRENASSNSFFHTLHTPLTCIV